MFKKILQIFSIIFLKQDNRNFVFTEIYINKTLYYKKEIQDFYLDWVYVALSYDEKLKNTLKKFKYKYNKSLQKIFIPFLVKLFNDFLKNKIKKENTIISWIPQFFLDFFKKWYNHTYILGKNLQYFINIPFFKILIKQKHTKQQAILIKKERLVNLKNVFYLKEKYKQNIIWKDIILIDDVISTWTTANEIAKILKKNWVKNVYWLFLSTGK